MKLILKIIGVLVLAFVITYGVIYIGGSMAKANQKTNKQKEICIIYKYQKDAEKFLDNDCQRYVNYKQ